MSAYIVAKITIHDRDRYGQYEAGFMDIFARHDGRMLAVDEAPEVIEGEWPVTRTVLVEFPDAAAMHAWYDSEDYQALAQHRFAASSADIVLLQGLPAPA